MEIKIELIDSGIDALARKTGVDQERILNELTRAAQRAVFEMCLEMGRVGKDLSNLLKETHKADVETFTKELSSLFHKGRALE